jgi:tetratricopeptide (TPR) repeat protein
VKLEQQIETLRAAQGDPLRLATVDVDLAHGEWPESQRERLRDALVLASIPHWFDTNVLVALADEDSAAASLKQELEALHCVERFVGRGPSAWNVDQGTRRAIRQALAQTQPDRFVVLSTRAVAHFSADASLSSRVEHIYHLLVADPDRGATACTTLCVNLSLESPPEHDRAIALALAELLESGVLRGRARAAAQLLVLTEQLERGEGAGQHDLAADVRAQFEGSEEPLDLVLAIDLQGQMALGQADRASALQFFGDALTRLEAIVAERPHDTLSLHMLAVAHTRLGDVEQAFAPATAVEHFSAAVTALLRWAEAEPDARGLKREQAVALARRADVLMVLPGRLAEAGADQQRALEMLEALARADPANANRRRDAAVQLQRVGDIAVAEERLPQALESYEAAVRVVRDLVESDGSRLRWQNDLASLLLSVGDVLEKLERFDAAEVVLQEALALCRHTTSLQPAGTKWGAGLGAALAALGSLAKRRGRLDAALGLFESWRAAAQSALQSRADDADARRDQAIACNSIGRIRADMGDTADAANYFAEAVRLMEGLVAEQPGHAGWQQDLANLRSWVRTT